MKKISLLLSLAPFFFSCSPAVKAPQKWQEHTKKAQDYYSEKLSAPSSIQGLYVAPDQKDFYFEDGKVSLEAKSPDHLKFTVDFKNSLLKSEDGKSIKSDEDYSIDGRYYLSFYFSAASKKARIFLYDLKKKNLERLRKRVFFKYNKDYVKEATFSPLGEAQKISFERSDKSQTDLYKIGELNFEEQSLSVYGDPKDQKETRSMLMFRDQSNGKESYGAGRYLVVDFEQALMALNGGEKIKIDFNFATNPPCSRSKAFHCPLAQDFVDQYVRAGEKQNF